MGGGNTNALPKQVLMVGLEGSGKTKYLYETYAYKWNQKDANTKGFNYEIIENEGGKIGIWDIGGNEFMIRYWSYFYQNILLNGVIYMMDARSDILVNKLEESKKFKECVLDEKIINFLINEEELKDLPFAICFNTDGGNDADIQNFLLHPFTQVVELVNTIGVY